MSILDGASDELHDQAFNHFNNVMSRVVPKLNDGTLQEGELILVSEEEGYGVALHLAERMDHSGFTLPEDTARLEFVAAGKAKIYFVTKTGDYILNNGSVETPDLATVKARTIAAVDAKAEDNITNGPGFLHASLYFSLSIPAQVKWTGLYNSRDTITYPFSVPTKDDLSYYQIADAAEVATMYAAAFEVVSSELDEANVVKQAVIAASTAWDATQAADSYLNG